MPPFSISASASTKEDLVATLGAVNAGAQNPVPAAVLDGAIALLDNVPEPQPNRNISVSIGGLDEVIEPDPDKPGSGQAPFLNVAISA